MGGKNRFSCQFLGNNHLLVSASLLIFFSILSFKVSKAVYKAMNVLNTRNGNYF